MSLYERECSRDDAWQELTERAKAIPTPGQSVIRYLGIPTTPELHQHVGAIHRDSCIAVWLIFILKKHDFTMTDSIISQLSSTPWAAALINDPRWTPAETASRSPKPSGEDSYFAETLGTNRTIRALLTLRPTKAADNGLAYKEVVSIVDLGTGVNGYPDIAHGGFVATLLDEICGILIVLNLDSNVQRLKEPGESPVAMTYFTAYLNTTYKRPVPTPGLLLCTAKIERQEAGDRKLYVRATIEDGNGTIYTTGDAMFVRATPKL